MPFSRYVPVWTGMEGAPGYTVLNFDGVVDSAAAQTLANLVRAWFDSMKTFIPNDVTISFPSEMTTHDNSGTLIGSAAVTTPPLGVAGSDAGSYSSPTGLRVQWDTGAIIGGRRLRGRTFIVPMAGLAFQNNGTVQDTVITNYTTYANTLISATTTAGYPLAVWSQVSTAVFPVVTASIPDQATVLRSRRD